MGLGLGESTSSGALTSSVSGIWQAMMSYEKLDVYRCSIELLGRIMKFLDTLPRGHATLHDQLKRASISIPLNIGEGAGKRTKRDCGRYFDNARGSAMECGAALDVCFTLDLISANDHEANKVLLRRIVSMLTKMV